jgi:hypothetical protein
VPCRHLRPSYSGSINGFQDCTEDAPRRHDCSFWPCAPQLADSEPSRGPKGRPAAEVWHSRRRRHCVCFQLLARAVPDNNNASRPQAIITPARTHPDVVIQAVAARSQSKAKAYAEKYSIPEVKATYQGESSTPGQLAARFKSSWGSLSPTSVISSISDERHGDYILTDTC